MSNEPIISFDSIWNQEGSGDHEIKTCMVCKEEIYGESFRLDIVQQGTKKRTKTDAVVCVDCFGKILSE